MFGVYVHVPWCRLRCPYCAFSVDTRVDVPHDDWCVGLARDWAEEQRHFRGAPSTLAFGGGTPSRARPGDIARVVEWVAPTGEVSLEANPEDVTDEAVAGWLAAGVTRVTVGVQSTVPGVARGLARLHTSRQSRAAVSRLRDSALASVGIDLMFGVDGQSNEALAQDLGFAIDAGVDHVSLYGLTIEAGTRFAARGVRVADDERWRALYDLGVSLLGANGLPRYEVSNFARPGHRAQHNEHYWRARPWAGLGPSAHGWRPDGTRVARPAGFDAWRDGAPATEETPTPDELLHDLLWSTLRHVDGVDRARVRALTGREVRLPVALVEGGLVWGDDEHVRLSTSGFPVADAVSEALWRASTRGDRRDTIGDSAYLPIAMGG